MPDPIVSDVSDAADSESHLEAAREFFPSPGYEKKPVTEVKQEPVKEVAKTVTKPVAPSILKPKVEPTKEPVKAEAPEAPEFEKLVGPDEKSKHRSDWDKMKAAAAAERKTRLDLEQKVKEYEAKQAQRAPEAADAATKARLAQLEQENKTFSEKLKIHDLASHPEFVAQYVAPVQAATKSIEATLKIEGIEANVASLLKLDGKAFSKAVSELCADASDFNKTVLFEQFRAAKTTDMARIEALGNVDQLRANIQQNFAARSKESFDAVGKSFEENFAAAAVAEGSSDPEEQKSVSEYNAALSGIRANAEKKAFGQTSETGVSDTAFKAASFEFLITQGLPRMERMFTQALDAREVKIAKLEQEIKDLAGSRPNVGGGGSGEVTPPDESEMDHRTAAGKYWK